jgi:hypothetical protein
MTRRRFPEVSAALFGMICIVEGNLTRSEAARDRKEIDKSTIRIASAVVAPERS